MTLPLILVYKRCDKKEKNYINFINSKKIITNQDLAWVTEKMKKYQVFEDCLQRQSIFCYGQRFLRVFSKSEEKSKIINLVDYLTNRKN